MAENQRRRLREEQRRELEDQLLERKVASENMLMMMEYQQQRQQENNICNMMSYYVSHSLSHVITCVVYTSLKWRHSIKESVSQSKHIYNSAVCVASQSQTHITLQRLMCVYTVHCNCNTYFNILCILNTTGCPKNHRQCFVIISATKKNFEGKVFTAVLSTLIHVLCLL